MTWSFLIFLRTRAALLADTRTLLDSCVGTMITQSGTHHRLITIEPVERGGGRGSGEIVSCTKTKHSMLLLYMFCFILYRSLCASRRFDKDVITSICGVVRGGATGAPGWGLPCFLSRFIVSFKCMFVSGNELMGRCWMRQGCCAGPPYDVAWPFVLGGYTSGQAMHRRPATTS